MVMMMSLTKAGQVAATSRTAGRGDVAGHGFRLSYGFFATMDSELSKLVLRHWQKRAKTRNGELAVRPFSAH